MQLAPLVLLMAVLVSSCQTADHALTTSSTPVVVTGPVADAIAGDMASRLAEQIGSARTRAIKIDKDTMEYATALGAALKGWGYSVITDGKSGKDQAPIQVSYSLDSFDGQILAQLTTSSLSLGRAYTATASGATPSSPLSIIQRK